MIFNVAGLLKEPSGSVRRHRLEDEELHSEEHGSFEQISGAVTMMRTDRTIMVTGRLETVTTRECSRCLEPAILRLQADIEEEYHPVNTDLGGPQRPSYFEEDPPDPVLIVDDRNNLDLSEAVLQSFSGMVPIAPLCKPDCLGLCPVCSGDRNKTPCVHDQNTPGPRWEGLAQLGSFKAHSPDS